MKDIDYVDVATQPTPVANQLTSVAKNIKENRFQVKQVERELEVEARAKAERQRSDLGHELEETNIQQEATLVSLKKKHQSRTPSLR